MKFNISKFKYYLKYEGSMLISMLACMAIIGVAVAVSTVLESKINNNDFFEMSTLNYAEFSLVIIGILCFFIPLIILIKTIMKKRKRASLITVLSILAWILGSTSFISIAASLIIGEKFTLNSVITMLMVTNINLWATIIFLVIGSITSLWIMMPKIQVNNWWSFATLLPFMISGWITQRYFIQFTKFKNIDGFSATSVYEMLKQTNGELNLMNEFQYMQLVMLIVVVTLMVGMVTYEFVWKKTEKWRQKAR